MGCNVCRPSATHAEQVLAEAYPHQAFSKPNVRAGRLVPRRSEVSKESGADPLDTRQRLGRL